jgi:hypothetical protein
MPHYDRFAGPGAEQNDLLRSSSGELDEAAIDDAAEALRAVEVEAVQPEPNVPDVSQLSAADVEAMNIDELRVVAKELDVPDRATITERDELVAAIRQRL